MRRTLLILVLLSCISSGIIGQTSRLSPSLKSQAEQALSKRDLKAAATLYERWLEADPRDFSSWYNLACVSALIGDREKSLTAWENSVEAGWTDVALAGRDPDLATVREDQRFKNGLNVIATRKADATLKDSSEQWAPMRVQGAYLVLLPPDYASSKRQYPVVVLLHGSGGSESGYARLADYFGRDGAIYIAVRAPYSSPGLTNGFTAWPPTQVPESTLTAVRNDYVEWVFDVVRAVTKNYRVRPRQVYIHGFSQGGQFAMLSALAHPDLVRSVFIQSGSTVPESFTTAAALTRMKNAGTAVWIAHGEQDSTVPLEVPGKLATKLKAAGISTTTRTFPGAHTITPDMYEMAKEWKKTFTGS